MNSSKPIILDHSYFGRLKYLSGTNIRGEKYGYWDCKMQTPLAPEQLLISIKVDAHGPTDEHRIAMEELILKFPSLQDAAYQVLFHEWSVIMEPFRKSRDLCDERVKRALEFQTQGHMSDVYELTSISIALEEECRYELYYSYNSKLGENDTTYVIVAVDRDWNVSSGGGGD